MEPGWPERSGLIPPMTCRNLPRPTPHVPFSAVRSQRLCGRARPHTCTFPLVDGSAIGMPSGTWDVISVTGAPTHAPTVAPTTVEPTAQPQAVRHRTLWPLLRPIRSARNGRVRSRGRNVRQVTPAPSYFRHVVNWTQPWWNRTESIAEKSEQQVCRASACHVVAAPGRRVSGKAPRARRPLRAPSQRLSCRRLVQRGRLWTWGCNQRGQLGLADGLYLGNIDYPNENTVRSGPPPYGIFWRTPPPPPDDRSRTVAGHGLRVLAGV